MLGALDFEFRKQVVKDEDYQYRSLDPKGAAAACQQIFNEARLQKNHKKIESTPKAKAIEFKKRAPVQTIQLLTSSKTHETSLSSAPVSDGAEQIGSSAGNSEVTAAVDQARVSKPKIMIVTSKKTI